jgi:hypothetical protein
MASKTTFLSQAEIEHMAEEAVRASPAFVAYTAMVDDLTATINALTAHLYEHLSDYPVKPSLSVVAGKGRGSKKPPAKLASVD